MSSLTSSRKRLRPAFDTLESRTVLSVTIQLDYSLDANGFFADPARRAVLQTAADTLGARLNDNLAAIVPSSSNTWTATLNNPATDAVININNLSIPANTILVFAGGRALSGTDGIGGPGGYNANSQAFFNLVGSRGKAGALANPPTAFGPWGGEVSFDTTAFNNSATGYFGTDVSKLQSGQSDFLSVALHELEHVLGFGTAPSWTNQVKVVNGVPTAFLGPISNSVYNGSGPVPLSPDGIHWASSVTDGGFQPAMASSAVLGTRTLPTRLDYAGLQDVGWTLSTDTNGTIAGSTDSQLNGLGSKQFTSLSIGPDPTEVDMFKLTGKAGQLFNGTTTAVTGGATVDTYLRLFDASGKELKNANTGIYDTISFLLPADGSYYLGISSVTNTAYSPTQDFARRLAGPTGNFNLNVSLTTPLQADLSVQVASTAGVTQGVPFVETITVTNQGPGSADSVELTEHLPQGVTYVAAVASQGSFDVASGTFEAHLGLIPANSSVTVQVTLIGSDLGPGLLTASVSSLATDTNLANNQASAAIVVSPAPTPPPTITGVQVLTTGKGAKKITSIVIHFSKSLDPSSATNVNAFALSKPGRAKRHKPIPRLSLSIKSATYSDADHTIHLTTSLRGVLPKGLQILVSASLSNGVRDLAGNHLTADVVLNLH